MQVQEHSSFINKAKDVGITSISARGVNTLQVNLGSLCNMACRHCHMSAGPAHTNSMSGDIADEVLRVLSQFRIPSLDITGGAPEMNPWFRYLASSARGLGTSVMVRTNLTVFFESGLDDLLQFFAEQGLDVAASLPSCSQEEVDRVRGRGTFAKSIDALRRLNALGYATGPRTDKLYLVHNPADASIPAAQETLEAEYRRTLQDHYGISFTGLFALANSPIGRFRDALVTNNALDRYQNALEKGFNAQALDTIMCRQMINVGWDGRLYDCDFNQALGIGVLSESKHIRDFDSAVLAQRNINVGDHCYVCTAGSGFT